MIADTVVTKVKPLVALDAPTRGHAAAVADILALGRAALDAVSRAMRTSPEMRLNRVVARAPVDLEDLLFELEPMQKETPIAQLAVRLGVSSPQLRSMALRLQRLALVKVTVDGVALTPAGRLKLARIEEARSVVLRRVGAELLPSLSASEAEHVISFLQYLATRAEVVAEEQLRGGRKM